MPSTASGARDDRCQGAVALRVGTKQKTISPAPAMRISNGPALGLVVSGDGKNDEPGAIFGDVIWLPRSPSRSPTPVSWRVRWGKLRDAILEPLLTSYSNKPCTDEVASTRVECTVLHLPSGAIIISCVSPDMRRGRGTHLYNEYEYNE